MADLKGMKVAILATDMFEEVEMTELRKALDEAGAETHLISPKEGKIIAANHFDKSKEYPVDVLLSEADPDDYDALLLPGGALNADFLRTEEDAKNFARSFDDNQKPIAVICHGPWLLVSAGVVKDRQITSFFTIQDDLRNAGADWVDQEVVRDHNLVSSRQPDDIPAFNEAMLELFEEAKAPAGESAKSRLAFGERIDE